MQTYKNRYQAEKARKTEPCFNGDEIIVKVDGGFVLMDALQYRIWKKQK